MYVIPKTVFILESEFQYGTRCAPSILITFINMVLQKETPVEDGCNPELYPGQMIIQKFLFVCALLCVPWMLLAKPIYIMRQRKQKVGVFLNHFANYKFKFSCFWILSLLFECECTNRKKGYFTNLNIFEVCEWSNSFLIALVLEFEFFFERDI